MKPDELIANEIMKNLKEALEEVTGSKGAAKAIANKIGKNLGVMLAEKNKFRTMKEAISFLEKNGLMTVNNLKTGEEIEVVAKNTVESVPGSDLPLCWFIGGILSGIAEKLESETYLARELKCPEVGESACRFIIERIRI